MDSGCDSGGRPRKAKPCVFIAYGDKPSLGSEPAFGPRAALSILPVGLRNSGATGSPPPNGEKMSDDNIIKNEPAVEAANPSELTEKDLETVTGGSSDILPKEQVSLSFSKIEFKYKEQKPDGD
jgi:hypothetical protein